jgi:hypothetical protein
MGDPVVDGARRDVEYFGQLCVGGAQQAMLARKVAMIGAISGGASEGSHEPTITTSVVIVNNYS